MGVGGREADESCARLWARPRFAAIGTVTYQGVEPADMKAELVEINGGPGIVFRGPGRVIATVTFDFDADGRITAIHNVANSDKLQAVAEVCVSSGPSGVAHTITPWR